MWRDEAADPPALVCQTGGTQLRYRPRCIDDLDAMLMKHGGWMPLGGADDQKPVVDGTVEAWGRSPDNPLGGCYGLKNGLRGRHRRRFRLERGPQRSARSARGRHYGHPRSLGFGPCAASQGSSGSLAVATIQRDSATHANALHRFFERHVERAGDSAGVPHQGD